MNQSEINQIACVSGLKRSISILRAVENAIIVESCDDSKPMSHVVFQGYGYILEDANEELETVCKALCGDQAD